MNLLNFQILLEYILLIMLFFKMMMVLKYIPMKKLVYMIFRNIFIFMIQPIIIQSTVSLIQYIIYTTNTIGKNMLQDNFQAKKIIFQIVILFAQERVRNIDFLMLQTLQTKMDYITINQQIIKQSKYRKKIKKRFWK